MRILPHNSISFKSIPLYDVKLKKQNPDGTYSEIPATFSKLEYGSQDDISEMKYISENWNKAPYGTSIAHYFLTSPKEYFRNHDFYVVEEASEKGDRQIYSIAKFSTDGKIIELLQANPDNKIQNIKGAGEVMLWGIAKKNQSKEFPTSFRVGSSVGAVGFYKKAGLSGANYSFRLPTDKTDEFLDRIEEKYNFSAQA